MQGVATYERVTASSHTYDNLQIPSTIVSYN